MPKKNKKVVIISTKARDDTANTLLRSHTELQKTLLNSDDAVVIQKQIQDNNKQIIYLLKEGILPSTVSQDKLIEWCTDIFMNYQNFSPFDKDETEQQFLDLFAKNKGFLNLLITEPKNSSGKYNESNEQRLKREKREKFIVNILNNQLPDQLKIINKHVEKARNDKALTLFTSFSKEHKKLTQPDADGDTTLIQEINDKIMNLFSNGIPASVSQDMLIEWYQYHFETIDTIPEAKRKSLEILLGKPLILERLLLGKGSELYDPMNNNTAAGTEFLKNLLRSGPYADSKIDMGNFPTITSDLGILRLSIDKYLLNDANFSKTEKENIKQLKEIFTAESKTKWEAVTTDKFHSILHDDNVKLNIKRLIYRDLQIKAEKNDSDLAKYAVFLKDYSTFNQFTTHNLKTDPIFIELNDLIESLEKNYYSIDAKNEIDINLDKLDTEKLNSSQQNTIDSVASYHLYVNTLNTLPFLKKKDGTVPDFVSRDDLVNLFIFDPTRLLYTEYDKNPSFVERMGNIDEFIQLLNDRIKKINKTGLIVPDHVPFESLRNLAQSQAELTEQKNQEKLGQHIVIIEESSHILLAMNDLVSIGEQKNQYQSQLKDIQEISVNINKLNLGSKNNEEFIAYLNKVQEDAKKHEKINTADIIAKLDSLMTLLDSKFKTLKEIEKYLNTKKTDNEFLDPELQIAYTHIQKQLSAIDNTRKRIDMLKIQKLLPSNEQKNIEVKEIKLSRSDEPIPTGSNKEMILYYIIMTKKSILEGKPNFDTIISAREYLNKIQNDPKLTKYIKSPLSIALKLQIDDITNVLIIETARQLRISGREALAMTDRAYFSSDPNKQPSPDSIPLYQNYIDSCTDRIRKEIDSCKDKRGRKKINSFWVGVMKEAYANKDQLTLNIVKNALQSQDKSQFKNIFFKSTKERFEQILKIVGEKDESKVDYLDNIKDSINKQDYDFIPDPTVYQAHAAVVQKAVADGKKPSYSIREPLIQFEKALDYIQSHFAATPNEQPIIHAQNEAIEQQSLAASNAETPMPYIKNPQPPEPVKVEPDKTEMMMREINSKKHQIRMTILPTPEEINQHAADKVIAYLNLIKEGWDALDIKDIAPNTHCKHTPRDLISDFLRTYTFAYLQHNQAPSLSEMKNSLEQLQKDLNISVSSNKVAGYFRKRFSGNTFDSKHLLQINEDIHAIHLITASIEAYLKPNQEIKVAAPAPEPIQPQQAIPTTAVPHAAATNPEPMIRSHIPDDPHENKHQDPFPVYENREPVNLTSGNDTHQNLSFDHFADFFPLSGEWKIIEKVSNSGRPDTVGLQTPVTHDTPLLSTLPREYVNKKDHTKILEMHENNLIKVSVTTEPDGYATLNNKAEKTNIDLMIANSMVSVLVSRCGNTHPIEILDSPNESRMFALILVCQERKLKYTLAEPIKNATLSDETTRNAKLKEMRQDRTEATQLVIVNSKNTRAIDVTTESAPAPAPTLHR